ncbi:flavodoxin [Alloscardovia theropitheci]|uniref:Flavodoxin n=1 Tax=Alloscardovia theropitheci TaxID=2496842 RepID=A0A4R0QP13_9BIFI|nr:flavodoxin [Alloscardovia theropitheci]TCD53943.1 flavodoxin [Alloscardovia theropitheci]
MNNIKKTITTAALITTLLFAAACSPNNSQTTSSASQTSTSESSSISQSAMDPNKIDAPQVGLSDEQWNRSLGTRSDGKDTNSKNAPTRILTRDADSIIIYFSRSGSTELLASKVQALSKADVIELTVSENYSPDYGQTVQRANREREEENNPTLNVDIPDLSQYKTVYLGYPIWGMTLAEPVASFLEQYGKQLDGKTIAPFSTNGSYGLGSSVERIQSILQSQGSQVKITDAYQIQGNRVNEADSSLRQWFNTISK